MKNTAAFTTSELWDIAHNNLCNKRWSAAVAALEALAKRGSSSDILCDAKAYGSPEHLVQYLQDRIDAVTR